MSLIIDKDKYNLDNPYIIKFEDKTYYFGKLKNVSNHIKFLRASEKIKIEIDYSKNINNLEKRMIDILLEKN